jgi:hypothetical protein
MATLKQVGDGIRKRIKQAENTGVLPSREPGDGNYGWVRYDVRVSNSKKSGPAVNVTINGYEWLILAHAQFCGGQVETLEDVAGEFFAEWRDSEGIGLIAKVDAIVGRDKYEPRLAGETKLGICIVSARPTGVVKIET